MDPSWFVLPYELKNISFKGDASFRFSEQFAEKMLTTFTHKGDVVLDPFAGFGTTLLVAQKLERTGIGIEYDKERCAYAEKLLKPPNRIIHGSAFTIPPLPEVDFLLTSPPYMRSFDKENPFANYTQDGRYEQYLVDIQKIFSGIKPFMKTDARLVVEVSNTFGKGHPMTPLAWDVGKSLGKIFFLEREIIYCHENTGKHSYCLVFKSS